MTPPRPPHPTASAGVLRLVNTSAAPARRPPSQRGYVHLRALRMEGGVYAPAPAAPAAPTPSSQRAGAWSEVVKENLAARAFAGSQPAPSDLGNTDPRWLLAVKTSSLLEGGRAALLTPAKRRSVMTLAQQLGLRAFEASLVVAVVQDGARTGEGLHAPSVRARLRHVGAGAGAAEREGRGWAGVLGIAAAMGGVLLAVLIRWLEGP